MCDVCRTPNAALFRKIWCNNLLLVDVMISRLAGLYRLWLTVLSGELFISMLAEILILEALSWLSVLRRQSCSTLSEFASMLFLVLVLSRELNT